MLWTMSKCYGKNGVEQEKKNRKSAITKYCKIILPEKKEAQIFKL